VVQLADGADAVFLAGFAGFQEPRQPSSPSTVTPTLCAMSTTLRVTATL
jgi:hypothetical protein